MERPYRAEITGCFSSSMLKHIVNSDKQLVLPNAVDTVFDNGSLLKPNTATH